MADITKCSNDLCPIKETCYRHTAKDSDWQSYTLYQPVVSTLGTTCLYYYPTTKAMITKDISVEEEE